MTPVIYVYTYKYIYIYLYACVRDFVGEARCLWHGGVCLWVLVCVCRRCRVFV